MKNWGESKIGKKKSEDGRAREVEVVPAQRPVFKKQVATGSLSRARVSTFFCEVFAWLRHLRVISVKLHNTFWQFYWGKTTVSAILRQTFATSAQTFVKLPARKISQVTMREKHEAAQRRAASLFAPRCLRLRVFSDLMSVWRRLPWHRATRPASPTERQEIRSPQPLLQALFLLFQ